MPRSTVTIEPEVVDQVSHDEVVMLVNWATDHKVSIIITEQEIFLDDEEP